MHSDIHVVAFEDRTRLIIIVHIDVAANFFPLVFLSHLPFCRRLASRQPPLAVITDHIDTRSLLRRQSLSPLTLPSPWLVSLCLLSGIASCTACFLLAGF
ncbi:hypothetical protein LZ30DRAFT_743714 [Colletotrichum cereale]|nr:hypothetical protein LZ30DRAFT_743714 [Colletotrichum cereale]